MTNEGRPYEKVTIIVETQDAVSITVVPKARNTMVHVDYRDGPSILDPSAGFRAVTQSQIAFSIEGIGEYDGETQTIIQHSRQDGAVILPQCKECGGYWGVHRNSCSIFQKGTD